MGYSDGSTTSDTVSIFMTFTLSSTRLTLLPSDDCGYEQVFFSGCCIRSSSDNRQGVKKGNPEGFNMLVDSING
jgi:hypothetical protein